MVLNFSTLKWLAAIVMAVMLTAAFMQQPGGKGVGEVQADPSFAGEGVMNELRQLRGTLAEIRSSLAESEKERGREKAAAASQSVALAKSRSAPNADPSPQTNTRAQGHFSGAETSVGAKTDCEIGYWNRANTAEKEDLSNMHYLERGWYTRAWDLSLEWYTGKHMLDIGCGPRGSLEPFNVLASRTCADPLAKLYGKNFHVGRKHNMKYVNTGVESMPFAEESFDVVSSINNFDHVADPAQGVDEIFRVIKPGGSLIMAVEIHPPKPPCEPQTLPSDLAQIFARKGMRLQKHWMTKGHGKKVGTDAVLSDDANERIEKPLKNEPYWLAFHAIKNT